MHVQCHTYQTGHIVAHAHTRVACWEAMEDVRVQVLLHSHPMRFRRAGTPDDMEFILGCIRNVICERAVSKELQRLLLEAIGPLCKFSITLRLSVYLHLGEVISTNCECPHIATLTSCMAGSINN